MNFSGKAALEARHAETVRAFVPWQNRFQLRVQFYQIAVFYQSGIESVVYRNDRLHIPSIRVRKKRASHQQIRG